MSELNKINKEIFKDTIVITNRSLVKGNLTEQIKKVTALAPHGLILREKDLSDTEYEELAIEIQKICQQAGVEFFIHSDIELAKKIGCKSIHASIQAGANLQANKDYFHSISISCHSLDDVKNAIAYGATQIILGTIFETQCKKGLKGKGLEFVHQITDYCKEKGDIPVYAIGGISPDNLSSVKSAGAKGGCMMSFFMEYN